MSKRFHVVGHDGATHLFAECGDASGAVYRGEPAKSEQPVPMGKQLAFVTPDDDGTHYRIDFVGGAGPTQVANAAYRDGWDETFGRAN